MPIAFFGHANMEDLHHPGKERKKSQLQCQTCPAENPSRWAGTVQWTIDIPPCLIPITHERLPLQYRVIEENGGVFLPSLHPHPHQAGLILPS